MPNPTAILSSVLPGPVPEHTLQRLRDLMPYLKDAPADLINWVLTPYGVRYERIKGEAE